MKASNSATQVTCEVEKHDWTWNDQSKELKTCRPNIGAFYNENSTIFSATSSSIAAISIKNDAKVKFLPKNLMQTFRELIVFQVWNCSLTTVENKFKRLAKLEYLNLAFNKIKNVVSDAFVDLVNLKNLNLEHNKLQTLGKATFASLKELKNLNLGFNKIHNLHPEIFRLIVKVEELSLNNNRIQSLDENIFESLTGLETISLAKNNLTEIPKNLFKENRNLEKLSIHDNKIKINETLDFSHLVKLKSFDMDGNICIRKHFFGNKFYILKNCS